MRYNKAVTNGGLCFHWCRQFMAISRVNYGEAIIFNAEEEAVPCMYDHLLYIQYHSMPCGMLYIFSYQMGAKQTQSSSTHAIGHQYFSSLSLTPVQNPTALTGRTVVSHQKQIDLWKGKAVDPEAHAHMLIPLRHEIVDSGLCGGAQTVELEYEPYGTTLEAQLKIRAGQGKHLEEGELWYLAWVLVQVSHQTSQAGGRLEDIKPSNIFMNTKGNIKVLTPYSTPQALQPYLNPSPTFAYFSPEELDSRREGLMFNETSSDSSEAFSIGMTLLTAGLIGGQFDVYNYPNNKLNATLLEDRLKKLEQVDYQPSQNEAVMSYSPMFIDIVRRLLDLNHETRLKRGELYSQLLPNVNSIMHLEPFSLEPPKGKISAVQAVTHTSPVKMQFAPLPQVAPVPVKHQVVLKTSPATTTVTKTSTNVVFKTQGGTDRVDFSPPKPVQAPLPSQPVPVYQPGVSFSPPKPIVSYQPPKPAVSVAFSPPRPDDGSKDVVVLRGRKKEEAKVEEVSFGGRAEGVGLNLAESQYVASEGGVDWLKRIDEQLERSRQMFPK